MRQWKESLCPSSCDKEPRYEDVDEEPYETWNRYVRAAKLKSRKRNSLAARIVEVKDKKRTGTWAAEAPAAKKKRCLGVSAPPEITSQRSSLAIEPSSATPSFVLSGNTQAKKSLVTYGVSDSEYDSVDEESSDGLELIESGNTPIVPSRRTAKHVHKRMKIFESSPEESAEKKEKRTRKRLHKHAPKPDYATKKNKKAGKFILSYHVYSMLLKQNGRLTNSYKFRTTTERISLA